jgi:hypothetical protein
MGDQTQSHGHGIQSRNFTFTVYINLIEAMNCEHNRRQYIRAQRLINIIMAKAYRTASIEALCMLTGLTPITSKLEELAHRCKANQRTVNCQIELDCDVELKKKVAAPGRRSNNKRS